MTVCIADKVGFCRAVGKNATQANEIEQAGSENIFSKNGFY